MIIKQSWLFEALYSYLFNWHIVLALFLLCFARMLFLYSECLFKNVEIYMARLAITLCKTWYDILVCYLPFQVIVERDPKSQIQDIDKRKFLVPNDISVAQFMWIIRKRIQLPSEKAIFLFVEKVLPQSRLVQFSLLHSFSCYIWSLVHMQF